MTTNKNAALLALSLGTLTLGTLIPLLSPASAAGMSGMPGMAATGRMQASSGQPGLTPAALAEQAQLRAMTLPMAARLMTMSGRVLDRNFMSMMIAHHQSAIDSSEAYLKRGRDPQVRAWAQAIISDQRSEIAQMRSLLSAYGGPSNMEAQMRQMMSRMDMGGRITASRNPERTFLEGMIPHHAGANETANVALQRTQTPAVLRLAQNIMVAQAREIALYQNWLRTHR